MLIGRSLKLFSAIAGACAVVATGFDPNAQTNLAVYWGAGAATTSDGLLKLCNNPKVDIVLLAFLGTYFGPNGWPSLKLGGGSCMAASTAQRAKAPGLVDCSNLGGVISQCQAIGKPVLLGLGGSTSTANFSSRAQAVEFASTVWSLFGADTTNITTRPLRPFGPNVVLDGFDIDAESYMPDYYGAFATALRAKYASTKSKPFYLSGSPRCPIPDGSLPLDAMLQFDWVWPRFYNAKKCQVDSTGFLPSLSAWSQQLRPAIKGSKAPRLYAGITASPLSSSGYVAGASLNRYIGGINTTNLTNFGGLMLWDASMAMVRDAGGVDYISYTKQGVMQIQNAVS